MAKTDWPLTKSEMSDFLATLPAELRLIHDALEKAEYLLNHDTLSDNFQIWAECMGVFDKYGRKWREIRSS